jgi:hypothetical protein
MGGKRSEDMEQQVQQLKPAAGEQTSRPLPPSFSAEDTLATVGFTQIKVFG